MWLLAPNHSAHPSPRRTRVRPPALVLLLIFLTAGFVVSDFALPAAVQPATANGRIAFASARDGNREIYIMNADGTGQANLTSNPADDDEPAWSPDGTQIAFQSNRGGNLDVYVMKADGSGLRQLTSDAGADASPRWSPDGTRIAFTSNRNGLFQVYVMNSDGSGVTRLTTSAVATEINPRWSPDGTRIAFSSDRSGTGTSDIYIMAADGTDPTQLTANAGSNYDPAWSPDGAKLLFWSGPVNAADVYVMNADGTGVSSLSQDPADDVTPSWSPQGTAVVFSSNRGGNYGICVMAVDGSGVTCLTNNGDVNPDWGIAPVRPAVAPVITWANPGDVIYGTPLGPSQLNATADVPGTFTYAPQAGTLLQAAAAQTLSATFTPADTVGYLTVTATARLNVARATPTLTWTKPAAISQGTPLGPSQLSATASVAGTFIYKPRAGTILPVGPAQPLSVIFLPADGVDYTTAAASTTIDVQSTAAPLWPTYQVLHHFLGADGARPEGGLVQGADGSLYGTTFSSGPNGAGTLYRMETEGALSVLQGFGSSAGASSYGSVIAGSDGQFYGTTSAGGGNGAGTAYRADAAGALTTVHAFTWSDGAHPNAGLILGDDGFFYGTTSGGGQSGAGTVVRLNGAGVTTMLHAFTRADGEFPASGLIQASDGNFYGTTLYGGPIGAGVVYRMDRTGVITVLHAFMRTEGAYPYAGLLEGSDGYFYGTTISGGSGGAGTVFRMDPSGAFTVLHAFKSSEGTAPYAALIQGSDGFFYGTTSAGGSGNAGTVYRVDASGKLTLLHAFTGADGAASHASLLQASDGFFYGTTSSGGAQGAGTVFRVTPVPGSVPVQLLVSPATGPYGSPTTLSATVTSGDTPLAAVPVSFAIDNRPAITATADAAGRASVTGVSLSGIPAGMHTIRASFAGDAFRAVADGTADLIVTRATPTIAWPSPADIQYGTPLGSQQLKAVANTPGTFAYNPPPGTVLRAGTAQPLSVVFTPGDGVNYSTASATTSINVMKAVPAIVWNNPADIVSGTPLGNAQLNASVTVAGTLTYTPGAGTVLATGSNQALTVVFAPADDASYASSIATVRINVIRQPPILTWAKPAAIAHAVPLGSGELNATANVPGTFIYRPAAGTILPVGAGQSLSVTFTPTDEINYGTAVAKVTIDVQDTAPPPLPTYQVLHGFVGSEGVTPHGTLVEGRDGSFYATSFSSGPNGTGAMYRMDSTGAVTVLSGFTSVTGGSPYASPIEGSDGQFYGTTSTGGASGAGTIYRLDATATLSTLHAFTWSDGARPNGGLIQATDGFFYATTSGGGQSGAGTVVRMDASGTTTTLHSFTRADGEFPASGLIQGSDGNFYGTTLFGGPAGVGVVYRMDRTGAVTVLHAFVRTDGAYPYAGLLEGSDGQFYGTTSSGGSGSAGTVFRMDPSGAFTVLHAFKSSEGTAPYAALIQGSDGFFYGTTTTAGPGNAGTVYRVDAAGKLTLMHAFVGADGASPRAGLIQSRDGFFYGTASSGGAQGAGTAFRITPVPGTAAAALLVAPASGVFGGAAIGLSATLTSETAPLSGQMVSFAVDGRTPVAALTDSAGVARVTGVSLAGLHGGMHGVRASFAGDALHAVADAVADLIVTPALPIVSWPSPADTYYGTPLGSEQLRATANVPGTFAYDPPQGRVLSAGAAQILSVVFTPTNTADYGVVSATRSLTVRKAIPRVVWDNPADVFPGTALGSAQLNASVDVPGVLTYTPATGTVLSIGLEQSLTVSFTPADLANYTTQTASVAINVPEPQDISGTEKIKWLQMAPDAAALTAWRYALYLDGARIELSDVSCEASTATEFLCSAPLPDIAPGMHTLALGTFTIPEGTVIESVRSAQLIVFKAAVVPQLER